MTITPFDPLSPPPLSYSTLTSTISMLPNEILSTICGFLSDPQTLKMKEVCKNYFKIINTDTKIQTRIAYRYLLDRQHLAGIPLDDIQYFLQDNRLVVDIKNDASVCESTKSLAQAFPWVTHLIIRKGATNSLHNLFSLMKNSTQLETLFLFECKFDQPCTLNLKIPNLYLCNSHIPNDISFSIGTTVTNDDAPKVFEEILGKETGVSVFQEKVSDSTASSTQVLQAFDMMEGISRVKVVSALWYAAIVNPRALSQTSVGEIQRLARRYIESTPHHPAVASAASSSGSIFS